MPAICLKAAATGKVSRSRNPLTTMPHKFSIISTHSLVKHLIPNSSATQKDYLKIQVAFSLTASGKPTHNVQFIRLPNALFADTEAAENHAQEVVGVEFAGDGVAGVLRQAQVFGKEFELVAAAQGSEFELGLGGFQRAQVAAAGEKQAFAFALPADLPQQSLSEQIEPGAVFSGKFD